MNKGIWIKGGCIAAAFDGTSDLAGILMAVCVVYRATAPKIKGER